MEEKKKKIEKKQAEKKVEKKVEKKKFVGKKPVGRKSVEKDKKSKPKSSTKIITKVKKVVKNSIIQPKVKPVLDSKALDNKAVSKIIVGFDDEITSLIEQIENTPSSRVVITIPSGSDLLISSVLMKLVAQKAAELDKNMVIVTDDKTGERMARLAGFIVRGSTSEIDDSLWEKVESARENIKAGKSGKQGQSGKSVEISGLEKPGKTGGSVELGKTVESGKPGPELKSTLDKELGLLSESSDLVNKDFQDDIGREQGEDATVLEPTCDRIASKASSSDPMDLGRERSEMLSGHGVSTDGASTVRKVTKGGFEMTVDETPTGQTSVGKTPTGKVSVGMAPTGKPAGMEDPGSGVSGPVKRSLVGRDFSGYEVMGRKFDSKTKTDSKYDELPKKETSKITEKASRRKPRTAGAGIIGKISGIFSPATLAKISAVFTAKKVTTILIPLVVILVVGFAFVGWYLPEVVVSIEIESVKVEYEGEITALTSVDGTDVESLVIPSKEETVLKNGSDNGTATGVASRGEKATGTVIIFNKTTEAVSLPAGTVLSNGGLNFILQGAVSLDAADPPAIPMTQANGDVVAEAIGSDYNIEGGTAFVVGSYVMGDVSSANSDKFTGGSKNDYKVVSQNDIDKLATEVEKGLYKEAEDELSREGQDSRWVFVKSSIKNEVDGDVESDVPAGAEQDSFNVSLKTRSTVLYYDGDALNRLIEELLLSEFDEDEDMEGLELSEDLEKEIVVTSGSVDGGTIVLTVKVSGFVMPKLDEKKIENGLQARGWADGLKYLKQLDYVSGDPEIDFYPTWFPDFMKRMPSRKGRITVDVKNVAPQEESEDGEDDGAEGSDGGSDDEGSEEE